MDILDQLPLPLLPEFEKTKILAAVFMSFSSLTAYDYKNLDAGPLSETLSELKEPAQARTEKRLSHALKRMKSKGYYCAAPGDLLSKAMNVKDPYAPALFLTRCSIAAASGNPPLPAIDISDDIWYSAIENAMFFRHPEIFANPTELFGAYIDQDIDLIYTFALYLTFISMQKQRVENLEEEIDNIETEPAPSEDLDDLLRENKLLRERNEQLKQDLASAKQEHDKVVLKLEHDLADKAKTMEAEIDSLKEQNASLLEFILHHNNTEDEPEPEDDALPSPAASPVFAQDLPDSRVLFLGGHPNLIKKLEAKYPKWQFISCDNYLNRAASNIDVIFFWTNHASHKMQWNVFASLPNEPPVIYVTATNINRLEQEMLSGYNALCEKDTSAK